MTSRTAPEFCDAAATNSGAAMVPWRVSPVKAIALVWLTFWLIIVTDYPELSGPGLLELYRLVEIGAVLFSGLCFAGWLSSPALLTEGPSASVLCALALISGPAASLALPAVGLGTLDGWPAIVAANGVAVGITLVLQLWGLSRARRRLCC